MMEELCPLAVVVFIQNYMHNKIQTTLHQMSMITSECMGSLLEICSLVYCTNLNSLVLVLYLHIE